MTVPSPVAAAGALVSFTILAGGKPVSDGWQVVSIDVWTGLFTPSRARLVIVGGDPGQESFAVSESPILAPGVDLSVALGFDGQDRAVFSGVVRRQGIAFDPGQPSRLIVDAEGQAPTLPDGQAPVLTLTYGVSIEALRLTTVGTAPEIEGQISFPGSVLASPGCLVTLAGLGSRFNGDVAVSAVHHRMADGLWTTIVTLGDRTSMNAGDAQIGAIGG